MKGPLLIEVGDDRIMETRQDHRSGSIYAFMWEGLRLV
jgi:hypothetical protein